MKLTALLACSLFAGSAFAAGAGDVVLGSDNITPKEIYHPNCVVYVTQSNQDGLDDYETALMESLSKMGYATRGADGSFNSAFGDDIYGVNSRGQILAWAANSIGEDGRGGGEATYVLALKTALWHSEANISASIKSGDIRADKHYAYDAIAALVPKCVIQN
jgi:hypothetical protein